jgi:zinc and cadmium transporter
MEAWLASLLAVGVVSIVSLIGALALTLPGLRSHRFLLILVAMAAGTLVGDAFFHLLPEAGGLWEHDGLSAMGLWIVGGFLVMFALEVGLRSRHAHVEMVDQAEHGHAGAHKHHHSHHAHEDPVQHNHIAPFAWTNLIGDAIHNLLDGAVIATAFLVDPAVGIATTIAVVIHEVPQELGDFAVLLRAGIRPSRALALNFASALVAVLGAVLVLTLPVDPELLEMYGLPLIAGAFLYIAAADLVPELHHHSKGREAILILVAFIVGLAIMFGLLQLEESGLLATGGDPHNH